MATDYPGDDRGCNCNDPFNQDATLDYETYKRREAARRGAESRTARLKQWITARLPGCD